MLDASVFGLSNQEAIDFFRRKGLARSFRWPEVVREEHAYAFTVAKMMDTDLLATTKKLLDRMIAEGKTIDDFKGELIPMLQKRGWWGRQDVIDAATGQVVSAQLGSASRLETIFRTNMQSAYAAGHWESIEATKEAFPYLMYDAVDDNRTRPEHESWDRLVLPVDDDFWKTHYPPNGYNCRCGVIQMDEDDLADEGLSVSEQPSIKRRNWVNPTTGVTERIPEGIDPSFDYNVGLERARILAQSYMGKSKRHGSPVSHVINLLTAAPVISAFNDWVTGLIGGQQRGQIWAVGAFSPLILDKLQSLGVSPATGLIELEDRLIIGAKSLRKAAQNTALSPEQWMDIPNIIKEPDAVYWHAQRQTVIYVRELDDGSAIKVAVKPGVKERSKAFDLVRTASISSQIDINSLVNNGTYIPMQ